MAVTDVTLKGDRGAPLTLTVRVADNGRQRAAGFQHICPAIIRETAILFLFANPARPTFHMHNVHAPLDLAFIDADGRIMEIHRMRTYVLGAARHEYYRPRRPVRAALEVRAGFFSERGIVPGHRLIGAGFVLTDG